MRLEDQEEEVTEEKDVEEEPDSTGRENEEMKEEVANLHCGGHRGARDCSFKMEDKVPKKMEEEGDDEDEEQKRRYQSFKRKGERKHWRSFE